MIAGIIVLIILIIIFSGGGNRKPTGQLRTYPTSSEPREDLLKTIGIESLPTSGTTSTIPEMTKIMKFSLDK